MEWSGKRRVAKGGTLVVSANVVLLSALIALLLSLALGVGTKPAFGHAFFGADSVEGCGGTGGCRMDYSNNSVYPYEVSHADSVWSALGRVNIVGDGSGKIDINIYTEDSCAQTWVGRTVVKPAPYTDDMFLNRCNFNKYDYNFFEKKGTATHEFGHALGLHHTFIPNVMHTPSRQSNVNTPQAHDREDYHILW